MKGIVKLGIGAIALVVLAVAAVVVVTKLRSDDPNLATEAPAIPTSGAAAGGGAAVSPTTVPATTQSSGSAAAQPANVQRFVIDPAQSSAKYVVQETLRGLDATAVGTTSGISGEVFLTPQGLSASPKSTFKVDLASLKTDESMRDNFIRQNVLQSNRAEFQFAEFTIESITGFPTNYTPGQEVTLTLSGSMKVHGVTKPVTWQVKARQQDDFLTATADTDFKMTDFGITPPDVSIAKARDEVHVQVVFVAKRTAA
jgi:polyisoprenoid-binding protein YceI